MKKRFRFLILLAVLGVCFLFLWPTIRWYFLTSPAQKLEAQMSRQHIKEYASLKTQEALDALEAAVFSDDQLPGDLDFLIPIAKKMYKDSKKPVPANWTASAVLNAFPEGSLLPDTIEQKYCDDIFALKDLQRNAVKLGLDLSGGLSIVLRVGSTLKADDDPADAMARALVVLNNRIDQFGLTEPVIRTQGTDQIYIEIPGTADPERIYDIIMGKGSLTFRLQDEEATEIFNNYYMENPRIRVNLDGEILDASGRLIEYSSIGRWPGLNNDDIQILGVYTKDRYGLDEIETYTVGNNTYNTYIAVKKEIGLDGNDIEDAFVERNSMDGKPEVIFRLNTQGGNDFYNLTSANVNKNLAIVLDGKVKSYPRISTGIRDRGTITGFGSDEAENLALVLRTGALPVELSVDSQQSIGASLGEDTIRQGLYALLGGVAAVLLFMLFYYRSAGINAIVAQVLNFYIMFSVLSALNFTLTLPAIAGFILTIGMATDANVIIFERMKEEMKLGKTRKAVIEAGFGKAFWAIMDSNITTFIAALFLSQLGSGPIRGFAVSLSIGVFSSVFTALFVSRLIFDFGTDVMRSKKLSVSWTTRIQENTKAVSL